MPVFEFHLKTVLQTLDDGCCVAEVLGAPALSACAANPKAAAGGLRGKIKQWLEHSLLLELHQTQVAGEPALREMRIEIAPPASQPAWTQPVSLVFTVVEWRHGEELAVAYVPALQIEVAVTEPEKLPGKLEEHIRFALRRNRAIGSLRQLAWRQRAQSLSLDDMILSARLRTPRQIAEEAENDKDEKASVLEQAASNLGLENPGQAYEVDDVVAQVAHALAGRHPTSVLLVGPSGCGKTAVVQELARRRADFHLEHSPFWTTNGSRLVAGMSGFGMWQQRCQRLCREAAKTKAILHLDNLLELMEVGKSTHHQQGIAEFLRPHLARGVILAIAECTSEQLSVIERQAPHLAQIFSQVKVPEPDGEKAPLILQRFVEAQVARGASGIDAAALAAVDLLHRRYATYSAYPGRPLRFLRNLLADHHTQAAQIVPEKNSGHPENTPAKTGPASLALTAQDIAQAFARETGLPLFLLDEAVPLDLPAALKWFSGRVLGQPEAAQLVVDLIAIIKTRLARPHKPLASFLFIGPTGVGKTEMAKALAEFLFGSPQRMIRFDLSEFSHPQAVQRLIGGTFEAEGLLTARVREQPFAVLLLDEFEKADSSLFDLLLQVLGEGRLTDAWGRVADFCNTVIIMTSNLGAREFQKGPLGFGGRVTARQQAAGHFQGELQKFLRPEMFNRIDRIIPFAPLDEATVMAITRRELDLVRARDGLRLRPVTLRVSEPAIRHLAGKGFAARYGARHLKRTIEQELLVPLAELLNQASQAGPQAAEVSLESKPSAPPRLHVRLKANPGPASESGQPAPVEQLAGQCAELRRQVRRLMNGTLVQSLRNRVVLEEAAQARRRKNEPRHVVRSSEIQDLLRQMTTWGDQLVQLELEVAQAFYERTDEAAPAFQARHQAAREEWTRLLDALYATRFSAPRLVTLILLGGHSPFRMELAEAYHAIARELGATVRLAMLQPSHEVHAAAVKISQTLITPAELTQCGKCDKALGLLVEISGPLVWPRFEPEKGSHIFQTRDEEFSCVVETRNILLESYEAPPGLLRQHRLPRPARRRTIDQESRQIKDAQLGQVLWTQINLARQMASLVDECFRKTRRAALDE